jgi:NitT/TauT family transport system permease protein
LQHESRTAVIGAQIVLLVAIVALWQFASGRFVPAFFISSPADIYERLQEWVADGTLVYNGWTTALEALLGFAIGGSIGVLVGIVLGRFKFLSDVLNPYIVVLNSLPKVALAPLFVLWIGIGLQMKVTLTASIVFFLVFMNTFTGVRRVSQELVLILRLMGARERHLLTKVVVPSAFIWVFAGLRLSVPYALIGAIVGELVASNRGLGYLMSDAAGQFDAAGVFAALIAIMVLAALLNLIVKLIEVFAMPWERTTKAVVTA